MLEYELIEIKELVMSEKTKSKFSVTSLETNLNNMEIEFEQ